MYVEVLPYDPAWATHFQEIKKQLEEALTGVDYISIEHVGSTSVPGLAAKPVLDIDIILESRSLQSAIEALTGKAGYTCVGEYGIPDRHAFRAASHASPARNLYVCIHGCQAVRNHLAVRDLCRRDAEVREKYGALKLDLATRQWRDVNEYCDAKSELLAWMLQKAGMSGDETRQIEELNSVASAVQSEASSSAI